MTVTDDASLGVVLVRGISGASVTLDNTRLSLWAPGQAVVQAEAHHADVVGAVCAKSNEMSMRR